jgi:hypothetical protein
MRLDGSEYTQVVGGSVARRVAEALYCLMRVVEASWAVLDSYLRQT